MADASSTKIAERTDVFILRLYISHIMYHLAHNYLYTPPSLLDNTDV